MSASTRVVDSRVVTILAVALCTTYFVLSRALRAVAIAPAAALTALRVERAIARWPTASLVLANAAALGLSTAPCRARFAAHGVRGLVAHGALYAIALGAFALAIQASFRVPATLSALEADVGARWPERWFARQLANPLDAVWVRSLLSCTLVLVTPAAMLVVRATCNAYVLGIYLVGLLVSSVAHEDLDHTQLHNHLFRASADAGRLGRLALRVSQAWLTYVLAPVYLRVPNWYRAQHLAIHHVENNGLEDTQTLLKYDRASYFDFCRATIEYAASRLFALDLVAYLRRHHRTKLLRLLVQSMIGYHAAVVLLALYNPAAAIGLFVLRLLVCVPIVVNHYHWHGLADVDDPANVLRGTTSHVAQAGTLGGLGAAYHVEHHEHPARHWSELRLDVATNHDRYVREHTVQLVFGQFLSALFARRYDALARVLRVGGDSWTPGQIEALVRERTRPAVPRRRSRLESALDERAGRLAARIMG